jgi:isopentenyl diphosphate isomerase/L-lactate dehydrogenase-like FMN-dependent dehydrogenase
LTGLARAACIGDLRAIAKRRIPRFAFDLVDGGAEDESNLRRNEDALRAIRLTPRYLVDASKPQTETEIFGQTYKAPFGIAPIGMLNVFWPDADLVLARLAAKHNVPYCASAAASTPLERLAEAADGRGWFQLYASADQAVTDGLLDRAQAAGYRNLLVTVDVPAAGKRDRDIRNELSVPFKFTPRTLVDLAWHPRWSLATLRHGKPNIANYADLLKTATSYAEVQATLIAADYTWDHLLKLRDRWPGRLIVKGLQHAQDAVRCVEIGCDGVVVSNHGGRQVAAGPGAIEALPAIAEAVNGRSKVLFDSGIRRGSDIIRAKALGADFTLLGRSFAYGVGAGGAGGAQRAFDIIELELNRSLGQLGRPDFANVDATLIYNGTS